MRPQRWVCPKCQHTVEAVALEIGHRCHMNKNRWTLFVRQEIPAAEQGPYQLVMDAS